MFKNKKTTGIKHLKIHLLVWVLYVFQEIVPTSILSGNYVNPLIYLAHYAVIIGFFYFFSDYSLPWALKTKTVWKIILIVCVQITVYTCAQYLVTLLLIFFKLRINKQSHIDFDTIFVLRNFYRCVLFMMFATGYYFLKNYLKELKKTQELERQRLEGIIERERSAQEMVIAQNAILKAQINPHFLFNTLDFIYHKVYHHSETAGEAVIKLAQLMRFAINSHQMEQSVILSEEIEQVENLLHLYQIRKSTPLNLLFFYDENVKPLKMIPLVLLTLVENIFKHADLNKEKDPAVLRLVIVEERLYISTDNLINPKQAIQRNKSGLANIQKRLCYAYGNEIVFEQTSTPTHFKVNISIPLKLLKLQ